ncbi:ankyrin repeat domain-containing protein SOWAHD [Stigmatopora nigra]
MDDSGSFSQNVTAEPPSARQTIKQDPVVERLSRYGAPPLPGAALRRSRLPQRRQEDAPDGDPAQDAPAQRKKSSRESFRGESRWALFPMEHAWMLSAAEGTSDNLLEEFVSAEPELLTRRDFVSGYSVLHWLAKSGRDDALLRLLHLAEIAGGRPVSVDVRGSGGLTPLHVASMHGHDAVVKLLVGAFGADVDVMDYGGRRPWQYLRADAPLEMKELLGTWDDEHVRVGGIQPNSNKNWNNSSGAGGGKGTATPVDEDQESAVTLADEVDSFDRGWRRGSWRLGSLRRFFSFRSNRR